MEQVATPERRSQNSINMKKNFEAPSGSRATKNEPKAIKEVLNDYFHSNEPLAMANRQRLASVEISAEKGGEV